MEKNLPEIIFGTADKAQSKSISRMVRAGLVKRIHARVYTSNLEDSVDVIVRRNLYLILSRLFPRALLSHRTALEGKPAANGNIYLT